MFRLLVISVLASVASVQCGTILTPALGNLVSEKVVESHGNSVVHATAPLVAAAAVPTLRYTNVALVQPAAEVPLVAERTIEAHGHQVVHNAHPALVALAKPLDMVESRVAVPAIATRGLAYASPFYYPHLVAEKTVSSYGHSIRHGA